MAGRLYRDLRDSGAAPWIDSEDLLAGQNWQLTISEAIRASTHFIALLSTNSINKTGYVQKELRKAIELLDMFPPGEVFVIPVRLDECQPRHERLSELHWIDLFPKYDDRFDRLLRSLGLLAAREVSEYDSYGPSSKRQTSQPQALRHLRRDEDGLLTPRSVTDLVLARVEGSQNLRVEPILLFENSHQRTWLVVTDKVVACVLDDTAKASGYDPLRWYCRHRFALPVETVPYKSHVGLIHFGVEHRDWLYSLQLHPDPTQLKSQVEALLR